MLNIVGVVPHVETTVMTETIGAGVKHVTTLNTKAELAEETAVLAVAVELVSMLEVEDLVVLYLFPIMYLISNQKQALQVALMREELGEEGLNLMVLVILINLKMLGEQEEAWDQMEQLEVQHHLCHHQQVLVTMQMLLFIMATLQEQEDIILAAVSYTHLTLPTSDLV